MPLQHNSFVAEVPIPVSTFVRRSTTADFQMRPCAAGELANIGISHEGSQDTLLPGSSTTPSQQIAAAAGTSCRVYGDGETCEIFAGSAIIAGQKLKPNAVGHAIPALYGEFYSARANQSVTAGQKVSVTIEKGVAGELTEPVFVQVASATVIAAGDLVYLASGAVLPATSLADAGTKAVNQEAFHDAFIGVALTSSANGETTPVKVATEGVFTFATASASYALGALVGAAGTGAGGDVGVSATTVESVATPNLAIGRVNAATTSSTSVTVRIQGTVNLGGPMAMA